MSEFKDPDAIYLQPVCCAEPSVGRLWSEDDHTGEDDGCGAMWTKYTRQDRAAEIVELEI